MAGQHQRQQSGIACEECRRKRIRCDRGTPQCSACVTSGADCVVRDSRSPRGPKKGYLKTLQKKKIEDLQTQLNKQQVSPTTAETGVFSQPRDEDILDCEAESSTDNNEVQNTSTTTPETGGSVQHWPTPVDLSMPMIHIEPWECVDNLYLNSPFSALDNFQDPLLCTMETQLAVNPMMHNDLDQLYFDRAYVFAPIVQAHRYRSWSKHPTKTKQQTCLQHAMWTLATSLSSQFQIDGCRLYSETRQLLHALESDAPSHKISLEQAQAWTLLAIYELTCEDYPRGLMSAGRAFRLVQMLRLYEVDAPQTPPPMQGVEQQGQPGIRGQTQEDWVDTETKRRTFWLAYTIDRFTSMLDGLHLFLDERMIRTRLPAPEANYASGRPTDTGFLADLIPVIDLEWPDSNSSSFTETVIEATICGRVLEHKQKPPAKTRDSAHEFCRRHRTLAALLAQRIKMLRMYASLEFPDPILTFTALAANIAVLMLYDLIESKPLGTETQAMQLTQALRMEHEQQSLDAVADAALLVTVLGQHFQVGRIYLIALLISAPISSSSPSLSQHETKLADQPR
ncbi:hypothetical protein ANO11243_007710 [Dothideomycetidae sp. 11243]|nr:hypothetical protein ANO11243_007710 [fungal sp. No.11243]